MISHNPHSNCLNARLYYCDFLSERTREGIPESALHHIKQCRDCQAEIERLEALLVHAEERVGSEQSRRDAAISTLLKLHFARAGEPVTCATVKPFLASLADPVLPVRVPTPITMHVDKCGQCSDDVQALRDLQLTHKQLCHLGQLLADEPAASEVSCSSARAAIPAVMSIAFRETDAETLKHLCICPSCRKHLYRRREAVRQKLLRGETTQGKFPCEAVSAADIYDYTLPYGIDPANDQYAEFRPGLTSHLRACPNCLAGVQELHRTISAIAERAESNVVTVYHLDESVEAPLLNGPAETGAGSVAEVTGHEQQEPAGRPGAGVDFAADLKLKVSPLKAKPVLKAGLAAAAVVLIGLGLLLYSPSATAVTIDQIYSAVERVRNIHITTLTGEMQEQWVSQGLNVYLIKTGPRWTLSDISIGVTKSKDSHTGIIDEKQLAQDEIAGVKSKMSIILTLMPFHDARGLPPDTQWTRVTGDTLQSARGRTEVYDLTWTESTYSAMIENRRRFFVDPETKLPRKIEFYQKQIDDRDHSLRSAIHVEYMSDAEVEAVIKAIFL
ncbi:MAG: hypothetical protein JSW66_02315 [Phycisphaerales bacterium]|nr:MAG: hypothetical protein JSW66_02315 [Phycisphaerales bacterium]